MDLAAYLDKQRAAGVKELEQIIRGTGV